MKVKVIGAGLAGVEAVNQLTRRGIEVILCEMKPSKFSPAHSYKGFAELVCSNSLKADRIENACGLLKEEMRLFDSIIMRTADKSRVPAGGALAVDREIFSDLITEEIKNNPLVTIEEGEVTEINPDEYTIIATGPLTSDGLSKEIEKLTGSEKLYFYDAAAPVVLKESIDFDKVFYAARYDKGTPDYINCPFTKEEYDAFYEELVSAETVPLKTFEQQTVFEGCMPVETMAKRGRETLLFGPLKPVGLTNPKTGRDDSHAVVQLRQDDMNGTLYNLVGFQTNLKFGEQKRVFSMIPGLKDAEFVRYGVMHRNTYINAPDVIDRFYRMKKYPKVFFAGQITGVEGYVESAASGLMAGYNMARMIFGEEMFEPDQKNVIGALPLYITTAEKLQPMNANFGIVESLSERIKKKADRYLKIAERSIDLLNQRLSH
ncbi:MAG: methylenetetrahydrofolate--tRNA-(uracil(54)-C(5))-methyltransferase (FADH(2)-oxidizing) TrmFO [Clostridia bacterium]|nr:methylenetetrahydrofolate--tRNA-(uracil(54)-C(5))-methyltransferase (FADH(2)-oxidizing) TrmFO [Clostridia bacterium]